MKNIYDPGDCAPEKPTTREGHELLCQSSSTEESIGSSHSESQEALQNSDFYSSSGSYDDDDTDDDDDDWEDAPECGTLVNVKQTIGENVTRVHLDFTSSLHKSQWQERYFPSGTFPY